jgi:Dyp-type peroxidase family
MGERAEMSAQQLKLGNIQGNILAGFNKDHQAFLLVNFPEGSDPKGWLAEAAAHVATSEEVATFNALFKAARARRGNEHALEATWMNLAISASGLQRLGIPQAEFETFPQAFKAGAAARAAEVGDTGASAPANWIKPFGSTEVHALVIIAADQADDLDAEALRQIERLGEHDLRLLYKQEGRARSDLPGHEHFGFKDGVSQPGIRGFTRPDPNDANLGKPGEALLWPGEFVLGYPGEKGPPQPAPPLPGPPYGPQPMPPAVTSSEAPTEPGAITSSGPEWTADGSYLVFRRLRQNVAAFDEFLATAASAAGIEQALLGAKLVGRYKSGCPLEHTKDEDPGLDTQTVDPSLKDPSLLEDAKVNNFAYAGDPDGDIVPRSAHIRKFYPRDEPTPGGGEADTQTHRILRRGIAYGASYDPGAPTDSPQAGDVKYPHDRGLLFLCYQHSLEEQFEFLQKFWINSPNFPVQGDGQDPVIAQEAEPRSFAVPQVQGTPLSVPQFVTTTGAEYFFAPSITALEDLAAV